MYVTHLINLEGGGGGFNPLSPPPPLNPTLQPDVSWNLRSKKIGGTWRQTSPLAEATSPSQRNDTVNETYPGSAAFDLGNNLILHLRNISTLEHGRAFKQNAFERDTGVHWAYSIYTRHHQSSGVAQKYKTRFIPSYVCWMLKLCLQAANIAIWY